MTKHEYKQFEDAVRLFFEREGIQQLGSPINEDPFFSSNCCECCRRNLAGSRWTVPAVIKNSDIDDLTYNICDDCLYYINYGVLDDTTMEEMV